MVQVANVVLNRTLSSFHSQMEQTMAEALSRLSVTAAQVSSTQAVGNENDADDEMEDDLSSSSHQPRRSSRQSHSALAFHVSTYTFKGLTLD